MTIAAGMGVRRTEMLIFAPQCHEDLQQDSEQLFA
jgi:hypothetical protein